MSITVAVSSPVDTKLTITDQFSLACFLSSNLETSYYGSEIEQCIEIDKRSDPELFDATYAYYLVVASYNGIEFNVIFATEKDVEEDCVTYTIIICETDLTVKEVRSQNQKVRMVQNVVF